MLDLTWQAPHLCQLPKRRSVHTETCTNAWLWLVSLGLKVNPQKTAFIATDKHTDKALRALLQPDDPPVETVMRDLGVDHQGARRRRIPVMKQRLTKAHTRKIKLRTLRIPALKIRLRLHRGGIQPAAL